MLETARGIINIEHTLFSDSVRLEFKNRYGDESVSLVTLDQDNLDRFIKQLTQKKEEIEAWKQRREHLAKTLNFSKLYRELHDKYFPHPYDPSPESIFRDGVEGGDISVEIYRAAKLYYGSLWDYVGD